jgi:hypothetical protein
LDAHYLGGRVELAESAIKKAQCDVGMTNKSDKPSNKPVPPVHQENGRNPCPAMVVCAVICEPVSTCNSLLTGKLTGNFANSGLQARKLDEIVADNQSLVAKFPKKHNREFFRTNRELRIDNRDLAFDRRRRPFLAHLFRAAADAICSHR